MLGLSLLALIGCAPQVQPQAWRPPGPAAQVWQPPVAAQAVMTRQRVALLLPLTGSNAALGHAMLNAAQMALFEQQDARVEFLPRDTRGTAAGAAAAARSALAEGATILVGPLTLAETAAAAPIARGAGAPMLALTSDETQGGEGVWVAGLGPGQVGRRLAQATGNGRLGVLVADDEFGRRLVAAIRDGRQASGGQAPVVVPLRGDPAAAAQALAQQGPYDAVVIGAAGLPARLAAQALPGAGLAQGTRVFGTHLWHEDSQLAQEPSLAGALYPGPDSMVRRDFDARYNAAFGERPARLAGTAYDAAALAARGARDGGRGLPLGEAFQGADGPIRLVPGGVLARGIAILEMRRGEAVQREAAPIPGAAGS